MSTQPVLSKEQDAKLFLDLSKVEMHAPAVAFLELLAGVTKTVPFSGSVEWMDRVHKCYYSIESLLSKLDGTESNTDPRIVQIESVMNKLRYRLSERYDSKTVETILGKATRVIPNSPGVFAMRDASLCEQTSPQSVLEKDSGLNQLPPERRMHEAVVSMAKLVADAVNVNYTVDQSTRTTGVHPINNQIPRCFIGKSEMAEGASNSIAASKKTGSCSPLAALLEYLEERLSAKTRLAALTENEIRKQMIDLAVKEGAPVDIGSLMNETRRIGEREPKGQPRGRAPPLGQDAMYRPDYSSTSAAVTAVAAAAPAAADAATRGGTQQSSSSDSKQATPALASQYVGAMMVRSLLIAVRGFYAKHGQVYKGNQAVRLSRSVTQNDGKRVFLVGLCPSVLARTHYLMTMRDAQEILASDVLTRYPEVERQKASQLLSAFGRALEASPSKKLDPTDEESAKVIVELAAPQAPLSPSSASAVADSSQEKPPVKTGTSGGGLRRLNAAISGMGVLSSAPIAPVSWDKDRVNAFAPTGGTKSLPLASTTPLPKGDWIAPSATTASSAMSLLSTPSSSSSNEEWTEAPRKKRSKQQRIRALEQKVVNFKEKTNTTLEGAPGTGSAPALNVVHPKSGVNIRFIAFDKLEPVEVVLMSQLPEQLRFVIHELRRLCLKGVSSEKGDLTYYWIHRVQPLVPENMKDVACSVVNGSRAEESEPWLRDLQRTANIDLRSQQDRSGPRSRVSSLGYSRMFWESERVRSLANWLNSICSMLEAANFRQPSRIAFAPTEILYHTMEVFGFTRSCIKDGVPRIASSNSWLFPPVAFRKNGIRNAASAPRTIQQAAADASASAPRERKDTIHDAECNKWRIKIANVLFFLRSAAVTFCTLCPYISKEALKGTVYEALNCMLVFYTPSTQMDIRAPSSQARNALWGDASKVSLAVKVPVKSQAKQALVSRLQTQIATRNRIADFVAQYWILSGMAAALKGTRSHALIETKFMVPWCRRYELAYARWFGMRSDVFSSDEEKKERDRQLFLLPAYLVGDSKAAQSTNGLRTNAIVSFLSSHLISLHQIRSASEFMLSRSMCRSAIVFATMEQIQTLRYRCALNGLVKGWMQGKGPSAWESLEQLQKQLRADCLLVSIKKMDLKPNQDFVGRTDLRNTVAGVFESSPGVVDAVNPRSQYNRLCEVLNCLLTYAFEGKEKVACKDAVEHSLHTFAALIKWIEDEAPVDFIRNEFKQLEVQLSDSAKKSKDFQVKVTRFHELVWDGNFYGCCRWLDDNLSPSVTVSHKLRLQKALYAASGQAHSLVRVKGVSLIESAGVEYAETAGALLNKGFRDLSMKLFAYSPSLPKTT